MSQLTEMEANIKSLLSGPNASEEQIATIPVKITHGPDLSAEDETHNIEGSLGAISRIQGIHKSNRPGSRHKTTTVLHSLSWDASHDLKNDMYHDFGMNEEDFVALCRAGGGDSPPGGSPVFRLLSLRTEYGSLLTYARVTKQAAGEAERCALEANQRVTQVEGAVGSLQNAVSNQFTEQRGHIDHQATDLRLIQENYLSLERRIKEAKQQLEACILAPLAAEAPAAAAGGGEGGQVQYLNSPSISVLKELVRKYKDDKSYFWRSLIMVSGIGKPRPHYDAHTQARSQL